jgi:hypothetical protein
MIHSNKNYEIIIVMTYQYVTWKEPSGQQPRRSNRSQYKPQEDNKKWSSKVIFLFCWPRRSNRSQYKPQEDNKNGHLM